MSPRRRLFKVLTVLVLICFMNLSVEGYLWAAMIEEERAQRQLMRQHFSDLLAGDDEELLAGESETRDRLLRGDGHARPASLSIAIHEEHAGVAACEREQAIRRQCDRIQIQVRTAGFCSE